mmetsp:Transcript_17185/g.51367  ORF Transcript_17185/g.51367 Transcript_17185/m.51367 type:complete len:144 (+) Transcript_17185:76-507(+)|eukprot:CAMPEP_0177629844 /NCGR_PEP_ID=MMETSP0447-20121125/883_1 /TAXON_ID=0 /ORGANISM="Stygamoeba regulata, Strain BSH-02190019" /LENGTH=143 /DNA_ID=CAMNT_0019131189 /DNA_START=201 /DNA_END=632 /DNA_ORIENTATION=-
MALHITSSLLLRQVAHSRLMTLAPTVASLHPNAQQNIQQMRFASKKAGGTSKNNRDSRGKSLGPKKTNGQIVKTGNIIVRQRGNSFHPGPHVGQGRDYTLFALTPGHVKYTQNRFLKRKYVSVVPLTDPQPRIPTLIQAAEPL